MNKAAFELGFRQSYELTTKQAAPLSGPAVPVKTNVPPKANMNKVAFELGFRHCRAALIKQAAGMPDTKLGLPKPKPQPKPGLPGLTPRMPKGPGAYPNSPQFQPKDPSGRTLGKQAQSQALGPKTNKQRKAVGSLGDELAKSLWKIDKYNPAAWIRSLFGGVPAGGKKGWW